MLLRSARMDGGMRKADGGGGANVSVDLGLLIEGIPRSVGFQKRILSTGSVDL